ncbi:MAG: amidohydrolase family protein [Sphaerochaetaceae bacterium]|nr:amidohydrolase family protein [Sphaerochaetaceae bacterium]
MRIIDSHCHVYPEAIAMKAVKSVSDFYDGIHSYGDGRAASMKKHWENSGVDHAVIFSVATRLAQTDSINAFISNTVLLGDGFFTGLGTVHQDYPDMGGIVDKIISLGLKGIKLHPDTQLCAINDKRLLPLYEACEGRLPVLIHTGDYRYNYSNPDQLEPVLRMFPKTTFIGAHFSGWSVWDEAVERLHTYDNLFVDTSSTFHWVEKDKVKKYIRTFGSEKIMFGSDFPMWDVDPELDAMLSLNLTSEEYENIFHRTAEKLFSIPN